MRSTCNATLLPLNYFEGVCSRSMLRQKTGASKSIIPALQALYNMGLLDSHVGQGPNVGQHCPDVWYPMLDKKYQSV